jgi:hypothetical protein
MMERPALLHNMSSMPRAVIAHEAPRPGFRAVAFRVAVGETDLDPASLLEWIDGKPWTGTPQEAERELRRRLDEHAATLPYPAAVLVSDRAAGAEDGPADMLTVCAVLAKSSGRVYLRDKEPNLANIRKDRVVVLQIPIQDARQC